MIEFFRCGSSLTARHMTRYATGRLASQMEVKRFLDANPIFAKSRTTKLHQSRIANPNVRGVDEDGAMKPEPVPQSGEPKEILAVVCTELKAFLSSYHCPIVKKSGWP